MDCAELEPGTAQIRDSFVPDQVDGIELLVDGGRRPSFLHGGFLVTMDGTASADPPNGSARLRGALALQRNGAIEYVEVDAPLPRAAAGALVLALENPWLEPDPNQAAVPGVPFFQAVLLALLGGLVLNLMPCVLPVLAIKVFGLAELAQHGRGEVARHGIAYTAGVLASMLALALVVAGLRAAGTSVGWGFQFQEPIFVAAIAAVLVVFALSLFGVFEFSFDTSRLANAGAQATGARRSVFEGLLAVVLATPCTAPFVGTAVGFAFASSTATIAAIFLAIGLGLALPFLQICAVPAWAKLVPRSGPWTAQLRAALGFALLGTAVWLLWVLGHSAGADAQAVLLAYLCALAAGVWVFGVLQRSDRSAPARIAVVALVGLALLGLRNLPVEAVPPPGESSGASSELGRRFSSADVSAARARGAPVFVYFTAEWCLTCKVNEHAVLSDARVHTTLGITRRPFVPCRDARR
jgi:thiol:disulfide interchange protein DsbD